MHILIGLVVVFCALVLIIAILGGLLAIVEMGSDFAARIVHNARKIMHGN
jgi:hypothetical protein